MVILGLPVIQTLIIIVNTNSKLSLFMCICTSLVSYGFNGHYFFLMDTILLAN